MDSGVASSMKETQENKGQNIPKKYIYASMLSAFIIAIDQFLKWAVLEHIIRKGLADMTIRVNPETPMGFGQWLASAPERLPFYTQDVLPFFNITMVWNRGVSFGLFASESDMGRYMLIALALVISGILAFMIRKAQSRFEIFAMATVIGGALGNVIDRFRFGAVADFLDFHAYGWHFPVFNIADAAITIGIAFLILYGLFLAPKDDDNERGQNER